MILKLRALVVIIERAVVPVMSSTVIPRNYNNNDYSPPNPAKICKTILTKSNKLSMQADHTSGDLARWACHL